MPRTDVLLILLAAWLVLALVAWAVVHVGARDDPPEWDDDGWGTFV